MDRSNAASMEKFLLGVTGAKTLELEHAGKLLMATQENFDKYVYGFEC